MIYFMSQGVGEVLFLADSLKLLLDILGCWASVCVVAGGFLMSPDLSFIVCLQGSHALLPDAPVSCRVRKKGRNRDKDSDRRKA